MEWGLGDRKDDRVFKIRVLELIDGGGFWCCELENLESCKPIAFIYPMRRVSRR